MIIKLLHSNNINGENSKWNVNKIKWQGLLTQTEEITKNFFYPSLCPDDSGA